MAENTTSPKAWVESPFKLISSAKTGDSKDVTLTGASQIAAEMTMVHNVMLRGINAIYNQASGVAARGTSQDKLDFANFAYHWSLVLEEHHHTEEEVLFPEINEMTKSPGLMDANVEEHKLFHAGLDEFQGYLRTVKDDGKEFDGEKLKTIVDGFMPQLRDHLENEIDTLLGLSKWDDEIGWVAWMTQKTQAIVSNAFKTSHFRNDLFPMTVICHDKTFEDGVWDNFPPMPWIMHVFLRWMFMGTRKNWWRFSGCDFYSMPQELPFA